MGITPRWILATKWEQENPVTKEVTLFYTPIGTYEHYLKRRKVSGIPFSYDTQPEAVQALNEILTARPELASGLLFCTLEVKYVPNKIKLYNAYWHKKYVLTEIVLSITPDKFKDTIK